MQTLTPWTAPDPVVRQLSDPQGFQKAVKPSGAASTIALTARSDSSARMRNDP